MWDLILRYGFLEGNVRCADEVQVVEVLRRRMNDDRRREDVSFGGYRKDVCLSGFEIVKPVFAARARQSAARRAAGIRDGNLDV